MLDVLAHPSPNHTDRRGTDRPDMVVLHYTAMPSAEAALYRLSDPVAAVSAHYLIGPDGAAWRLVAEDRRAWHAGMGSWGAVGDVNSHSIGIELAHPGHHGGWPPYPEAQMAALERLLRGILDRWAIPPERVVGHADVAPGRKIDPGEKFDWRRLARQGLAVWLDRQDRECVPADARLFTYCARILGYGVELTENTDAWNQEVRAVWRSIAMRFMPDKAQNPLPDCHDVDHVARLARHWPVIDAEDR